MSLLVWIWFLGFASEFVYLWIEWYRKGGHNILAAMSGETALILGLFTLGAFTLESVFWFISMPWKLFRDYRGNHG